MSTDDGGLSPREHDELRDLVLAGTQRIRPAGAYRAQFVAAGVALVLVGAVTGGVITATLRADNRPIPAVTSSPAPTTVAGAAGWIAYSSGHTEGDIYLVKPGSAPHRVIGSDVDDLDQVCPAFSADGTRLASGEGRGDDKPGWLAYAVVFTDLTADGEPTGSTVLTGLGPLDQAPCPIWSSDGRWVAFAAKVRTADGTGVTDQVWVVAADAGENCCVRPLTGLAATDIEWAPDGAHLYISHDDGISVYSIEDDQIRTIPDTLGTVAITASPDGETLAVERRSRLWLMNTQGTDRRVLVENYAHGSGIGPVWSPDGNRIVLQRTGAATASGESGQYPNLGDNDEVVIVTVGDGDPLGPAGTQTVVTVQTNEGSALRRWIPSTVSWAPNSAALRFVGWELLPSGEMAAGGGLLAVPVDSTAAPTILWETPEGIGPMSMIVQNDFQAWSR